MAWSVPPGKVWEWETWLEEGEMEGRREKEEEPPPVLEPLLERSNLPIRERVSRISPAIADEHEHKLRSVPKNDAVRPDSQEQWPDPYC